MRGHHFPVAALCAALLLVPTVGSASPKVITSVRVGGFPLDAAIDPTTGLLYVANWNTAAVDIVDTEAFTVVTSILLGSAPWGIAVDPERNRVYAVGPGNDTVSVIDTATNQIVSVLTVGSDPRTVSVHPDSGRAFVTNYLSDTVSIIDGDTLEVVGSADTGDAPLGVAVNPTSGRVYVANSGAPTVTVLDAPTGTLVKTVSLPDATRRAWFPAVNPFTNRIFVQANCAMYEIDGRTDEILGPSFGECTAYRVAIDPRTNQVYVPTRPPPSCSAASTRVWDLSRYTLVAEIAGESGPSAVAVNPEDGSVYVVNHCAGTIQIIRNVVEARITSGPSGTVSSTTATFTFESSESNTILTCALDAAAAFTTCTSPKTYTALPEGTHTFRVRATDTAGNQIGDEASRTWTIDLSPPDTTITDGPSGFTNSTTARFTFTSTEAEGTSECEIDGKGFTACVSPVTYNGLTEGAHTFKVLAKDLGGTSDPSPAVRTWTIDLGPPDTTITGGPTGVIASSSASFTFTSEANAGFECALATPSTVPAESDYLPCTSPRTYEAVQGGPHSFYARAVDVAGNRDPSPARRDWTVDATAPVVTFTGGPDGPTNTTDPVFTFEADEPATFECSLDRAPFAVCVSPKGYTGLTEGAHILQVRATDALGNITAVPVTRQFAVDLQPPDTSIDGPSGWDSKTTAVFELGSDEVGSSFQCRLDSDLWDECSSPAAFEDLAPGAHTISVRARDPAGNIDPTPVTETWRIDTTPPALEFTGATGTLLTVDQGPIPIAAGPTTVRFRASDAQSNISTLRIFVGDDEIAQESIRVDPAAETYSFVFRPPLPGLYGIKALATNGASVTSEIVVDIIVMPTSS